MDGTGDMETGMNILFWVLQVLAALMYASSGIMKIFMFDSISQKIPSFGAMLRHVWLCLGFLELICVAGLIAPSALRWHPMLTVLAAALLAAESLVFIWVHMKYAETSSVLMSAVLGLLMLFIAYGRLSIKPIL